MVLFSQNVVRCALLHVSHLSQIFWIPIALRTVFQPVSVPMVLSKMMENASRKKNVRVSIKITGTTQAGFLLASERAPPHGGKIENFAKAIVFL